MDRQESNPRSPGPPRPCHLALLAMVLLLGCAGHAAATEGALGRSITGMQITPCVGISLRYVKEFGVRRRFEGEPSMVAASFGF